MKRLNSFDIMSLLCSLFLLIIFAHILLGSSESRDESLKHQRMVDFFSCVEKSIISQQECKEYYFGEENEKSDR